MQMQLAQVAGKVVLKQAAGNVVFRDSRVRVLTGMPGILVLLALAETAIIMVWLAIHIFLAAAAADGMVVVVVEQRVLVAACLVVVAVALYLLPAQFRLLHPIIFRKKLHIILILHIQVLKVFNLAMVKL